MSRGRLYHTSFRPEKQCHKLDEVLLLPVLRFASGRILALIKIFTSVKPSSRRTKMASTLTDKEMDELRDNFGLYDTVGDGKVESANMGQMLRAVGLNPTQAEVEKVMKEIDPTGNRRISFEEFVPVVLSFRSRTHKYGQDVFIDSLRVFDSDGSGSINSGELRHVLTSLGERLKDEDVDMLIQGFEDNTGLINYEDFVKSVMNG